MIWPELWRKRPKLLKILKIEHFSEVRTLLPVDLDHKAKEKQLDTQLNMTLL